MDATIESDLRTTRIAKRALLVLSKQRFSLLRLLSPEPSSRTTRFVSFHPIPELFSVVLYYGHVSILEVSRMHGLLQRERDSD